MLVMIRQKILCLPEVADDSASGERAQQELAG